METNSSKGDDPNIAKVVATAEFMYYRNQTIRGEGNIDGATVFRGYFNGTIPIALKRYQTFDQKIIKAVQRDLEVLSSPDNRHPNFIRYFGHAKDKDFSYLATELCECSVADIINPKRRDKIQEKTSYVNSISANLSLKEILRQSTEAVNFLHSLKKVHRNLHPDNFLIFCVDPTKDHFIIKLTDFQCSRDWAKNPELSGTLGSEGWIAPESLVEELQLELDLFKTDAFIMGCYYFYVLSGGRHPFGEGVTTRRSRLMKGNDPVFHSQWDGGIEWSKTHLKKEEAKMALSLIKDLIKFKPSERTSLKDVLESQFFRPDQPYLIYDTPNSSKPGLCVIISQGKYHNPTMDLEDFMDDIGLKYGGIVLDAKKLESTFTNFGYQVLHLKNLRAQQMEQMLSPENLAKESTGGSSLSEFSSLVVCILGHGEKGAVLGADGAPVLLKRLQYTFNGGSYPDLRGKPKVFIILACQGDNEQLIMERTIPSITLKMTAPVASNPQDRKNQLPPLIDFLSLMSTVEEFQSYMKPGSGSLFISSLCDALQSEYNVAEHQKDKRDLAQLFSSVVIPKVGRSGDSKTVKLVGGQDIRYTVKQTPEFHSSLTKTIRFRPCSTGSGVVKLVYDGERDDPSFKFGREYYQALGYRKKKLSLSYS